MIHSNNFFNVNKSGIYKLFSSVAIFSLLFLLTRQGQIPQLSGLAAPLAIIFLLTILRCDGWSIFFLPLIVYTSFSALLSSIRGIDLESLVRFCVILLGTAFVFHVRMPRIGTWVLVPLMVQAAIVITLSLGLAMASDSGVGSTIRSIVINNGWGDVYSFDGIYYRVQLLGNALLPLLYLILLFKREESRVSTLLFYISVVALLAAGNLTYYIVIVVAIFIKNLSFFSRTYKGYTACAFLILLLAMLVSWSFDDLLASKFNGAESSMGVRFDQISVAANAFGNDVFVLLLGAGIGSSFPDGLQRTYSSFNYIELQSLYLLYQIGVVGFVIYLGTIILACKKTLNKKGVTVFWLYILSGLSNPYILDTNQIVAVMIILGIFSKKPWQSI